MKTKPVNKSPQRLLAYDDTNYANSEEMRSVTGSISMSGRTIVVSVWRTQGNISVSSTEVEYAAAGVVTKEVLFVS